MSKVSFDAIDDLNTGEATSKNTASKKDEGGLIEIPADTSTAVALSQNELSAAGLSGEWGTDDIEYPKIKVVGANSDLVTEGGFPAGSINLNGDLTLVEKGEPLRVCVVHVEKKWQEDVDFDSGEIPKIFDTLQAAQAEGYTNEYNAANLVRPMARMVFVIEKPANFDDQTGIFAYHCEATGQDYTLAGATFAKTAFNSTAKALFSFAMLTKKPIHSTWWELSSSLKQYKDNKWFSPFLKRSAALSKGESEFVSDFIS